MKDILILGGARTPMTEFNGALRGLAETDLGALAIRGALDRTGLGPGDIDHVVMGNALQTSRNACFGARHAALKAGLPIETPALTVNRLCGSGIQSIISAAQMLQLDEGQRAVAGGMESMSQAPHVIRGLRNGLRLGEGALEDSLMTSLMDDYCGFMMAGTAEEVGRETGVTRAEADAYALRSQQAAEAPGSRGASRRRSSRSR
jgi:acetyl-CoA acetyltransferase